MTDDPVVAEVRRHRQEILESHGSLRAYHKAVLEKQKAYGERLVSLNPKRKHVHNGV